MLVQLLTVCVVGIKLEVDTGHQRGNDERLQTRRKAKYFCSTSPFPVYIAKVDNSASIWLLHFPARSFRFDNNSKMQISNECNSDISC